MRKLLLIEKKMNEEIIMSIRQGAFNTKHSGGRLLLQERPGVLPHKSDGGARQKILRTPVKGTRILFYGRVLNWFPP